MTTRIHHTVTKKAAKFGLIFSVEDATVAGGAPTFHVWKDERLIGSGATASAALAAAINALGLSTKQTMDKLRKPKATKKGKKRKAKKSDGEDEDEDEEGEEGDAGKSVIKKKYKTKYRPHKMTCGDPLAKQIRVEFMTVKDPDTKKLKIDWKKFTQFAKNNGCWSDEYKKVNNGMKRMNIVNRLRAKIEAGHEVVWAV